MVTTEADGPKQSPIWTSTETDCSSEARRLVWANAVAGSSCRLRDGSSDMRLRRRSIRSCVLTRETIKVNRILIAATDSIGCGIAGQTCTYASNGYGGCCPATGSCSSIQTTCIGGDDAQSCIRGSPNTLCWYVYVKRRSEEHLKHRLVKLT